MQGSGFRVEGCELKARSLWSAPRLFQNPPTHKYYRGLHNSQHFFGAPAVIVLIEYHPNNIAIYLFIYIHICIYIYIHTCMHACMHAYIHTYIHTNRDKYQLKPFAKSVADGNRRTSALSPRSVRRRAREAQQAPEISETSGLRGFGVRRLGFRVRGLGVLGFRGWGLGLGGLGFGFGVVGLGLRVGGLGFSGLGFRVAVEVLICRGVVGCYRVLNGLCCCFRV